MASLASRSEVNRKRRHLAEGLRSSVLFSELPAFRAHLPKSGTDFGAPSIELFLSPVLGRALGATELRGVPAGSGHADGRTGPGGGGAVAVLFLATLGPDGSTLDSQPFPALWCPSRAPSSVLRSPLAPLAFSSRLHGH